MRFSWPVLAAAIMAAVLTPGLVTRAATPGVTLHVDAKSRRAADTNSGSLTSPFKTINGALRAAARLSGSRTTPTILVHPGVYREMLIIQQPLNLVGQPGSEIRGSDPWTTGWTRAGSYWSHPGVPAYFSHGVCQGTTNRCMESAHAYYDGRPLRLVDGYPTTGQFALTPDRSLILADNPQGHLVEVTTRVHWIVTASHRVTIKGFRMRHAANDAQSGAIDAGGYSNITVTNNVLSDTHGAVLSFRDGSHVTISKNDISRGGELGIHLSGVTDLLIQSNRIHENNTDGFSWGWEGGGLKAANSSRLTLEGNDVGLNDGPGLWCDGDCNDVTVSHNRIHDNAGPGIQYEISHRAQIFSNNVWKNGLYFSLNANFWGWGAGILIQNSDNCEVFGNTLAWNRNGISVLEQDRGETYVVANTHVHDNIIVSQDAAPGAILYSLAWLSDYETRMFSAQQHNGGSSNKYGYSGAREPGGYRFAWEQAYGSLADFNNTPGEQGGVYLTHAQQDAMLSSARMPVSP